MTSFKENITDDCNYSSPFRGLGGQSFRGLGGQSFRGLGGFFFLLFFPNFIFAQFNMHFSVQQYNHALYNKLINRTIADNSNIIQTQTGTWEVSKGRNKLTPKLKNML